MGQIEELEQQIAGLKQQLAKKYKEARDTKGGFDVGDLTKIEEKKLKLKPHGVLRGHIGKIYALSWSEDHKIVTASQDGTLLVWDTTAAGRKLKSINLKTPWVMTCTYGPKEGGLVASAGLDNAVSLFNVSKSDIIINNTVAELDGHTGFVSSLEFLDVNRILAASGDRTCSMFDVTTQTRIAEFSGHEGDCLCLSSNGNTDTFVSSSVDGTARLWDIRTSSEALCFTLHETRGKQDDLNSVFYHGAGYGLAVGAEGGSCTYFDVRTVSKMGAYKQPQKSPISSVTMSPSGRLLFAATNSGKVVCFDMVCQTVVSTISDHVKNVTSVDISHDGYGLASCSWDSDIRVYAVK